MTFTGAAFSAFYAFYAFYAWWFIFRSRGPLQKVRHSPDTYVRPQLPPGAADGLFPRAKPHGQSERFHGWMAVQVEPTQSEPPARFPSRLDYYSCVRRLCVRPPWAKHWAPVDAPSHRWTQLTLSLHSMSLCLMP
jgi:hypothetical protein